MGDDFFNNLRQTLSDTAEVVGKKTEELLEVQKLRNRIRTAQRQVEQDYRKLGHMVFERFVEGETMDLELSEVCDHLIQVRNQIASFEEELARKKGQCICPACGKANPTTAAFCMYCGAVLPQEEVPDAEWSEACTDSASADENISADTSDMKTSENKNQENTWEECSPETPQEPAGDAVSDEENQSAGQKDEKGQ